VPKHVALLEEKIKDYKAENTLLGKLLQEYQRDKETLEDGLTSAHDTIQAREETLAHLQNEVKVLNDSLGTANAARRSAEAATADASAAQHAADARREQLALEASAAEKQLIELRVRLEHAHTALHRHEQARADLEATRAECRRRLAQVSGLEELLKDKDQQLKETQARLDELETLRSAWGEEWQRAKLAHKRRHDELHLQVEELETRLRDAMGQLNVRVRTQSDLQVELDRARQDRDECRARMEAMLQDRQREISFNRAFTAGAFAAGVTPGLIGGGGVMTDESTTKRDSKYGGMMTMMTTTPSTTTSTTTAQAMMMMNTEGAHSMERLREQLVTSAERIDGLMANNVKLGEQRLSLTTQLKAAEEALAVAREDVLRLRADNHALKDARQTEILKAASQTLANLGGGGGGGGGGANAGNTMMMMSQQQRQQQHSLLLQSSGAGETYVKLLEQSVEEAKMSRAGLEDQMAESHFLEGQARRLLAEARQKETEALNALQVELKRSQTLERMHLTDAMELSDAGKRLKLAQHEVWSLRDVLAEARAHGTVNVGMGPAPSGWMTGGRVRTASAHGGGRGNNGVMMEERLGTTSMSATAYGGGGGYTPPGSTRKSVLASP